MTQPLDGNGLPPATSVLAQWAHERSSSDDEDASSTKAHPRDLLITKIKQDIFTDQCCT